MGAATGTGTKTTMADVALVSELKDLGWNAVQSEDKSWSAHEHAGDLRSIGPASSVKALATQVKLAVGKPTTEANGNGKGKTVKVGSTKLAEGQYTNEGDETAETPSTRLPGMEEPAIEALDAQADICIEYFEKKKNAATASKDQDDAMRRLMHDYDRKRYSRRGWSIVIEDSEKLVIKQVTNTPPKNPKTK